MKVRPSVKRLVEKDKDKTGYFTRIKGRLFYKDKTKPRNKQRQG